MPRGIVSLDVVVPMALNLAPLVLRNDIYESNPYAVP
jgi:hypothetical protein